ncbi:MAG: hypothetical protein QOE76_1868, partial [Frankiales bacterium]|nr:hypothetical protein [Frankiales bacterium]
MPAEVPQALGVRAYQTPAERDDSGG